MSNEPLKDSMTNDGVKVPSPETKLQKLDAKKQRRINHLLEPMKLTRDRFHDDSSFSEYQINFAVFEHAVKTLFDENADLETRKIDLHCEITKITLEKKALEDKLALVKTKLNAQTSTQM